jgi:hypothetical protein
MTPYSTMAMWVAVALAAALATGKDARAGGLRFLAGPNGEFLFDTGVLSGKLRSEGKSSGLLPVVHSASGEILTSSMGFAGHYRVFSGSRRFGEGAWDWQSHARLLQDGTVEVHWPAAGNRPFALWAVYRWVAPATLDVETRVLPRTDLPDFEVFLAWYFNNDFASGAVLASDEQTRIDFVTADAAHGAWQMFPRDHSAIRLIQDGRWKVPPNPVDWVLRSAFARAIGLRSNGTAGLTALVMASPQDCFAISMPHEADPHRSLYVSLFGRSIKAGQTARAHTRTVIAPRTSVEEIERLYDEFLRGLP